MTDADATKTQVVFDEVATTQDGRDITRGFVESLHLLQPQDSVLVGRANGNYEVYEQIIRDDQVMSTFQQRRRAVISKEWEVIPGGKSRQDKRAARQLEEVLAHLPWDNITEKMLFGVFYGFAVSECLWARDGAQIMLDAVKVRKQRRFRFAPDQSLRLLTSRRPFGEELPPRKFWTFATGADNDDEPYGLGLAHWLYWPVVFKRGGIKFWLIFLDKFGNPTAVGKYPPQGTQEEDKKRLLGALSALSSDSGVIIPEGLAVELLQATRSGTADYSGLVKMMDQAISKITIGQTMTADDGSSRSQAEVHWDVRADIVQADADLICQSFNTGPARWLAEWNFPGAKPPQVWRVLDEAPDQKALSERDKRIVDMGFRPTLKYITETYGGEWTEKAAPAPEESPAQGEDGPTEFAEETEPDLPSQYAEQLDAGAEQVLDGMVDRIRQIVENAESLDEVRDLLLDAYGELDAESLAGIMARALTAAELAGRAEIVDEASDDEGG